MSLSVLCNILLCIYFPGFVCFVLYYTPNGYIVPAKFGDHFLPLTKTVPKRTKLHLNEIGLTNTEFCKSQSQLRLPPISWKIRYFPTFCNMGVRLNVTAMLCILCKYACTIFRGYDINIYRVHVNDNASNSDHSGVSYGVFYIYTL